LDEGNDLDDRKIRWPSASAEKGCYPEPVKVNAAVPSVSDTSGAAAAVQIRVLRGMPACRKVSLVEDANRTARCLALAGIALRFPSASREERNRLLMDLLLGRELAERVYGPRPIIPER